MFYFNERSLRALLDVIGYDVQHIARPARLPRNLRVTCTRHLAWPAVVKRIARPRLQRQEGRCTLTRPPYRLGRRHVLRSLQPKR